MSTYIRGEIIFFALNGRVNNVFMPFIISYIIVRQVIIVTAFQSCPNDLFLQMKLVYLRHSELYVCRKV